jgi:hypothetical protein
VNTGTTATATRNKAQKQGGGAKKKMFQKKKKKKNAQGISISFISVTFVSISLHNSSENEVTFLAGTIVLIISLPFPFFHSSAALPQLPDVAVRLPRVPQQHGPDPLQPLRRHPVLQPRAPEI